MCQRRLSESKIDKGQERTLCERPKLGESFPWSGRGGVADSLGGVCVAGNAREMWRLRTVRGVQGKKRQFGAGSHNVRGVCFRLGGKMGGGWGVSRPFFKKKRELEKTIREGGITGN